VTVHLQVGIGRRTFCCLYNVYKNSITATAQQKVPIPAQPCPNTPQISILSVERCIVPMEKCRWQKCTQVSMVSMSATYVAFCYQRINGMNLYHYQETTLFISLFGSEKIVTPLTQNYRKKSSSILQLHISSHVISDCDRTS
jgi:hypothetical protein